MKYGKVGIVDLLHQLFKVVWHKEAVPKQWHVVGKVFSTVVNNRLGKYSDYGGKLKTVISNGR